MRQKHTGPLPTRVGVKERALQRHRARDSRGLGNRSTRARRAIRCLSDRTTLHHAGGLNLLVAKAVRNMLLRFCLRRRRSSGQRHKVTRPRLNHSLEQWRWKNNTRGANYFPERPNLLRANRDIGKSQISKSPFSFVPRNRRSRAEGLREEDSLKQRLYLEFTIPYVGVRPLSRRSFRRSRA